MGVTGASLPIDDPFGFTINPAQLGHTSQTTNLSFMFYPSKVNLWGHDQFKINSLVLNLGYNLKDLVGIPLSIGFGYANSDFNMNYNYGPNSINLEDKDNYQSYCFGTGIDYFVQFNAGITFKNINSKIANLESLFEGPFYYYEANVNSIDFGFLLNVPVLKLIDDKLIFNIFDNNPAKPFFNLSFGYSQLNIGDEIYYVDKAQSDPLPRTARLGYGISTGLEFNINKLPLQIIGFDFTVDAEDLLLEYEYLDEGGNFKDYQSFTGDINVGKNIIQIEGDDNVISRAGFQIDIMETFSFRRGHLSGRGYNSVKTDGYDIRLKGILKFISGSSNNKIADFLANHIDMRFYHSNYSVEPKVETKINGLAFYFHNINSLF